MKESKTFKFTKGERIHLDEIYDIQGLAGGKWSFHRAVVTFEWFATGGRYARVFCSQTTRRRWPVSVPHFIRPEVGTLAICHVDIEAPGIPRVFAFEFGSQINPADIPTLEQLAARPAPEE